MPTPTPHPRLRLYDLLYEAHHSSDFPVRGRDRELAHIARVLRRGTQTNLILTGRSGVGKSTLLTGFAKHIAETQGAGLRPVPFLELDTAALAARLRDTQRRDDVVAHTAAAFATLPASVVVIDEADELAAAVEQPWQLAELFKTFITKRDRHLVLCLREEVLQRLQETGVSFLKYFDVLSLNEVSEEVCRTIIEDHVSRIAGRYQLSFERDVLSFVVESSRQMPHSHAWPLSTLHLLDETAASCVLRERAVVTRDDVRFVLSQRLGMPAPDLGPDGRQRLQQLPQRISTLVRGQDHAVEKVTTTIQRAWLGLKNPQRPLASFLFLGPSGVGKTELAKAIARDVYGSDRAFIRIDMSEFGEQHNVARLLGAPPGYVGYEAGGQLTSPVLQQPFSLVLLDEIEKAHPSVFDIFLQVFDDGRLTDGHGTVVDFTKTIIMATSNIGIETILAAAESGNDVAEPAFLKEQMMPLLQQYFRTEFLNRFEGIIVFNPLSPEVLLDIAHLEIQKIEERLSSHHVRIEISEEALRQKIAELYNPRFGARPLKRFIEQVCEGAVAERLLQS